MLARLLPRNWSRTQAQGVSAALLSAVVLGLAPIFGKQAMLAGTPPLSVVMLRTLLAVGSLWFLFLLFGRRYFYIYPVGLVGCLAAGVINGLGSLMYYTGLGRLDASLAQLLYTLYPVCLTLFARLDGHRTSGFTLLRMLLALAAVYLLTRHGRAETDWLGAMLMLGAGVLYAGHLVVNQRVLYDVPAPTVALYTLTGMAVVVVLGYLLSGAPAMPPSMVAWEAVLLLTLVTVISRVSLFLGVKRLGGLQTALIGLSELLVTVLAALLLLGETLSPVQWLGAAALTVSVLLVVRERSLGHLPVPRPWTPILAAYLPGRRDPLAPSPTIPPAVPADEPRLGD
jgi:drug/metabolite transporter (DMT)-like permease